MIKAWHTLSKEALLTRVGSAGVTLPRGPFLRQTAIFFGTGIQKSFGFPGGCHFEDQTLLAFEDHSGSIVFVALALL